MNILEQLLESGRERIGKMETKICKPVFDSNVFEVADLAEDYKSVEQVAVNMNDSQGVLSSYGEDVDLERLGLIEEVQV